MLCYMNSRLTLRSHAIRPLARSKSGFTLAELLVVVAIVIVLVAIAVPVFTGSLDSAQEATCAANRRSLKVIVADTWMLDQTKNPQETFDSAKASLAGNAEGEGLCPSGGTYWLNAQASNGIFIVKCSVHGLTVEEEMYYDVLTNNAGSWYQQVDPDGKKITSDTQVRAVYAKRNGIDRWPELKGADGTYYLQFKSYGNSSDTTFLYAGTDPDPKSTNPWNARYICDSTGVAGAPGQWYELPKTTNLGTQGEDALRGWLTADGVKPVTLEGGEFKPVS